MEQYQIPSVDEFISAIEKKIEIPFSLDYMQDSQRQFLKSMFGIEHIQTKKLDRKYSKIKMRMNIPCTSQKSETKVSLIDQLISQDYSQTQDLSLNLQPTPVSKNNLPIREESKIYTAKFIGSFQLSPEDFHQPHFDEKTLASQPPL
jgi:hypothetical protein